MIYVPLFKTSKAELLALKKLSATLNEHIWPLFEILSLNCSVKKNKGTLEYLDDLKLSVPFFVDVFRFSEGEYQQKNVNYDKIDWALKNRGLENYIRSVKHISDLFKDTKAVPVIFMKKGVSLQKHNAFDLISYIHGNHQPVCLRIESNIFSEYIEVLSELSASDYLMLDIREQPAVSQQMTYRKLRRMNLSATKILLNSPRKRKLRNPAYLENGFTDLIDNSALQNYGEFGFDGVGDYAGLKDKLPENGGGNGKGLAAAFMYCAAENAFWVARNDNTDDGINGFSTVIEILNNNRDFLDPDAQCPAFKEIDRLRTGNWASWIEITVIRYLDQINRLIYQV